MSEQADERTGAGTSSMNGATPNGRAADPARLNGHRLDGHAADEPAPVREPFEEASGLLEAADVWDQKVAGGLAFLRRRISGQYEIDEFGFDPELVEQVFQPMLRLLYREWFRTEVFGIEHLPEKSAALVVANHSGTVALDALMLSVAVHTEHPTARHLRLLGADLVFRMPFLS